jgi:hypothetical protein
LRVDTGLRGLICFEEAVTLFEKYRKTVALKKAGGKSVSEEDIRSVFSGFAKGWWAGLTPEQREAEKKKRSDAAKERWANERRNKK